MKVYVVVDIGCLHCDEDTRILLVTPNEAKAKMWTTGRYLDEEACQMRSIEMLEAEVQF